MGNAFALLGMRALFVLVDGLVRRFRYMRQTVALVLVVVAAKLLAEDAIHVPPLVGLLAVTALLAGGLGASLLADRRDRDFGRDESESRVKAPGRSIQTAVPFRRLIR